MGYAAWTPGERELLHGLDRVQALAGELKAPVISANVADASGRRLFPDRLVTRVGGLKVGITGFTSESSLGSTKGLTEASRQAREQYRILDPRERLASVIKDLDRSCDLVVLLAHATPAESQALMEAIPGVDVVVVGHLPGQGTAGETYGSAIVVRGGMRGQSAAHLYLTVGPGRKLSDVRNEMEPLVPGSPFEAGLDTKIRLFESELKSLRQKASVR